jgi:hypothetical protein
MIPDMWEDSKMKGVHEIEQKKEDKTSRIKLNSSRIKLNSLLVNEQQTLLKKTVLTSNLKLSDLPMPRTQLTE